MGRKVESRLEYVLVYVVCVLRSMTLCLVNLTLNCGLMKLMYVSILRGSAVKNTSYTCRPIFLLFAFRRFGIKTGHFVFRTFRACILDQYAQYNCTMLYCGSQYTSGGLIDQTNVQSCYKLDGVRIERHSIEGSNLRNFGVCPW